MGFTVPKSSHIQLNSFQNLICIHYFPVHAFKTKQNECWLKELIVCTSHHRDTENAEVSSTFIHLININFLLNNDCLSINHISGLVTTRTFVRKTVCLVQIGQQGRPSLQKLDQMKYYSKSSLFYKTKKTNFFGKYLTPGLCRTGKGSGLWAILCIYKTTLKTRYHYSRFIDKETEALKGYVIFARPLNW